MEYRIREFNNEFVIEVLDKVTIKSCLGMVTETPPEWKETNIRGYAAFKSKHLYDSVPVFKSLEAAREQIKAWEKGIVYHEPK